MNHYPAEHGLQGGKKIFTCYCKCHLDCNTYACSACIKKIVDKSEIITPERTTCKDCEDAARHAYSDATTQGFFYDKCAKHRVKL